MISFTLSKYGLLTRKRLLDNRLQVQVHSSRWCEGRGIWLEFHWNCRPARRTYIEVPQYGGNSQPRLHHSKPHSNAIPWPLPERSPGIGMAIGKVLLRETLGIELLRVGENVGIALQGNQGNKYSQSLFQDYVRRWHLVRRGCLPKQSVNHWVHAKGFCEMK